MDPVWSDVDRYIADSLIPSDPALEAALRASDEAGLPSIQVSAAQGKLLHILARAIDAKDVLELGTLGGYSTIWLARAVAPRGGRVISLEVSPAHAEVARANLARAGVAAAAEVRVGPALETLPKLNSKFDLVFIDADKPNIPEYFDWSVRLARPGALIIVDNVVRKGALADPNSGDENVRGVRRLHEMLAHDRRVTATTMQTVGSKGYDGFTIAIVG